MVTTQDRAQRVVRFWEMVARYDEESWRSEAACRDVETARFFPTGASGRALERADEARAICSTCPVQLACLNFAITTNQPYGIWGGYDEEQRRVLRRRWRAGGDPFDTPDELSRPAAS